MEVWDSHRTKKGDQSIPLHISQQHITAYGQAAPAGDKGANPNGLELEFTRARHPWLISGVPAHGGGIDGWFGWKDAGDGVGPLLRSITGNIGCTKLAV